MTTATLPLRTSLHRGMSLAEAIDVARHLGVNLELQHRGGELRFSHPLTARRIVVHRGRKDSTQELVQWLRLVERRVARAAELAEMDQKVQDFDRRGDRQAAEVCRTLLARMRRIEGIPAAQVAP